MTSLDAGKTEITVKTAKTFLGMAGQKNWDQPVIDEINKILAGNSPTSEQPAPASDAAAAPDEAVAAPAETPPATAGTDQATAQ